MVEIIGIIAFVGTSYCIARGGLRTSAFFTNSLVFER
jgi:hypothetical protein